MTKKAETGYFEVSDFAKEVHGYLGRKLNVVVYNSGMISSELAKKYEQEKSHLVIPGQLDPDWAERYFPIELIDDAGGIIRHHPHIASVIADL